ncbi:MAG: potassium channel protein [Ignavibacteriales bacterium]|nr:potassium channel protein [Ignavibacteriales bacterium]
MNLLRAVFRKFIPVFSILLLVIVIGTFGYWYLGHMHNTLFECFYMTMITITTVGYGEIVDVSHTPYGRMFTIIIALSGIGAFTFILTNFTAVIVSGELNNAFRQLQSLSRVKKMDKHYIICGSGEIGFQIAEELYLTKRQFVIIDKSEIEVSRYKDQEILFVPGDATDEHVLEAAGINRAAGLFAVTGDDNYNLVITFTARQMQDDLRIVAKCKEVKNLDKLKKAGADSVISPYMIGGLRMVSEMVRPTAVSFLDSMLREREKNFRVEEIILSKHVTGKSIDSLSLGNIEDALLLAVRHDEKWLYKPEGNYTVQPGDTFVFMMTPEARLMLEEKLGRLSSDEL